MSQKSDSTDNSYTDREPQSSDIPHPDIDLDQFDDHLKAILIAMQFHLSEPEEEAHMRRFQAVNHPETDPQVLHHIASKGSRHLASRVADHPRAGSHTLEQLAQHEHPEVRAALADNQNIPVDLQWQLASDEHPDVRFALAQCYHIDQSVLVSLLDDENPFVAHRAKTTLQRKTGMLGRPTRLPGSSDAGGSFVRKRAIG